MTNNNNNKLGLVDNVNTDHIRDAYNAQELQDAQAPIESGQPALNPNLSQPGVNYGTGTPDSRDGGYIQAGTVLEDRTLMFTDQGVHTVREYSHNTSAKHEARMRLEQQRARTTGKSIYSTSVTETPSIAPNVDDGERPTPEKLEELRQQQKYENMQRRLRSLKVDEAKQETRLAATRRAISNLQIELEELGDQKD